MRTLNSRNLGSGPILSGIFEEGDEGLNSAATRIMARLQHEDAPIGITEIE